MATKKIQATFSKPPKKKPPAPTQVYWLDSPVPHDYPSAANYLSLIADEDTVQKIVDDLQKAPVLYYRANDILRAATLPLLSMDDTRVKVDLRKMVSGEKLSPVLIVRGDVLKNYPLTIADGYHRVCASYHLSEGTYVPAQVVDFPKKEKVEGE